MGTGQEFVKKIKPFGSFLFLLLFVLFLLTCFTSGKNPIPGYKAPHESSYYSQNEKTLTELKTELENNVFPNLKGIKNCSISEGKLVVTIDNENFAISRSAILQYYDQNLFEFVNG